MLMLGCKGLRSKYFLVQLTLNHVLCNILGFDERRVFFFIDYGCSFLSIIFSTHFMSLSAFAFPYLSILFVLFFTPFTLLIFYLLWSESVNIWSGDLSEIT